MEKWGKREKSADTSADKSRTHKPGLLKALVAAGAIFAGNPADAQTTQPVLKSAPVLKREGMLAKFPATSLDFTQMSKSIQLPVEMNKPRASAEELALGIGEVEKRLGKRGLYTQKLEDPALSNEILDSIAHIGSYFSGELLRVEDKLASSHPSLESYLLPKRTEGMSRIRLPIRHPDGRLSSSLCVAMRVIYKGQLALQTNRHCIIHRDIDQKNDFEALESDSWIYERDLKLGQDIAIKLLPADTKPALTIDPEMVGERVGRFARLDMINRLKERVRFYTFMIPVTKPVLRILFPTGIATHLEERLLKGYWYVAPPEEQEEGADEKGPRFQGNSGSVPMVHIPGKGFKAAGPVFAGLLPRVQCFDKKRGLCLTIMFSAGLDGVVDLFENQDKYGPRP